MLNIIAGVSFVLTIFIIAIFCRQTIKTGRFIDKKSTIILGPTFLNTFILYLFGIFYDSGKLLNSIFYGAQYSVLAFAMRFNFDIVHNALISSKAYYLMFYVGIGLTAMSSVLVIIAFTLGKVLNKLRCLILKENPLVIIGFNKNSEIFYDSIENKKNIYFLIENDPDAIKYCLTNNIKYVLFNQKNLNKFLKKRFCRFVSFANDNIDKAMNLVHLFNDEINKYKYDFRIITDAKSLDILKNMTIENQMITVLCLYDLDIKKLMLEHQIAYYLGEKQVDYDNACLKYDTQINTIIWGFKDLGNMLYLDLILNSQFVKIENGKYINYPMNYFIYDSKEVKESNFNIHNLRHINELKLDDDYFPMPSKIENTKYYSNSSLRDIYKKIDEMILNNSKSDMNAFYFVSEDESENIDLGYKVLQKLKEGNVDFDYKIFIYATNNAINKNPNMQDSHIIIFGFINEIINYEVIVEDSLDEYAKRRAYYYELTAKGDINPDDLLKINHSDKKIIKEKNELWCSLDRYQKKSNIKSVVSIISKMAMLGLEISDSKDNSLTEKEYLDLYDDKHKIGKNTIYYDRINPSISKRDALAFLEHQRWNAFMICDGYVPMKKSLIRVYKDKDKIKVYKNDVNLRLHACITTFDGLEEYFDYIARLFEKSGLMTYEDGFNYIENKKYDYMLMDTAYNDILCLDKYIVKK